MQAREQPGASTPSSRFTAPSGGSGAPSSEQMTGLLDLAELRKRRIDGLEQSGHDSSDSDGRNVRTKPVQFKKRKKKALGALSFGDGEGDEPQAVPEAMTGSNTSRPKGTDVIDPSMSKPGEPEVSKRLKPNTGIAFAPRSQSKQALAKEAQQKQAMEKEYTAQQEIVKATEFVLPFVFFDGKDNSGGKVRMRKGDHIWLFLERARKVGAETAGKTNGVRKDWARISVDDLMLVRHELIIPAHYDFHYFISKNVHGYSGSLFDLSAKMPPGSRNPNTSNVYDNSTKMPPITSDLPASALEGFSDEPEPTKVVDRRWYEKHKHIYPASLWEDYDPGRDYSQGGRKDRDGNKIFFSR